MPVLEPGNRWDHVRTERDRVMRTVDVEELRTDLSRLLDQAAAGDGVIIARAGQPVAQLVPFGPPSAGRASRLGVMAGQGRVPDDFDEIGRGEIERMFAGDA